MSRMPTPVKGGPSAHLYRAAQMLEKGQAAQARMLLTQTLTKEPGNPWANQLMRHALTRLGEFDAALFYAQKVHRLAPDEPDTANILAASLVNVRRVEEAKQVLSVSLEKNPEHGLNHALMASIYAQEGRHVRCVEHCEKAFALSAGNSTVITSCASSMQRLGMQDKAAGLLQHVCNSPQSSPYLMSMLCSALQYVPGVKPADMVAAHFAFGRMLTTQMPRHMVPVIENTDPERRLRVGLLGADFRECDAACFIEPLLKHLDREAFDLHVYHHGPTEDGRTGRMRAYPGVRYESTRALPPAALAERIARDDIDILIDLSSHTFTPTLLAMHMRPAPVQATYLGYPFTSGVPSIDWRIVDSITDPDGSEKLGSERLWRLDPVALAYMPPEHPSEIAPCPSLATKDNSVTFGCFADARRIHDGLIRSWSALLRETPGSRLVIRNATLGHDDERAHLLRRFEVSGVAAGRVDLLHDDGAPDARLNAYARVDIALDTFPSPGVAGACEALFMGVPVVARAGDTSWRRGSAAVLGAAGLGDLVASDDEQYIEIARALARDPARRQSLRSSLRSTLMASPLADHAAFASRFGSMLRSMWREAVKTDGAKLSR